MNVIHFPTRGDIVNVFGGVVLMWWFRKCVSFTWFPSKYLRGDIANSPSIVAFHLLVYRVAHNLFCLKTSLLMRDLNL